MKTYPEDLKTYESWANLYWKDSIDIPVGEEKKIKSFIQEERKKKINSPLLHKLTEGLPYPILIGLWIAIIFGLPSILEARLITLIMIGLLHGIWGYSWVVYTLHEGAGHQLLKDTPLRALAFHSSRLMFADPVFYQDAHQNHHRFLGTSRDASFTQFINLKRFVKSLLPGAGILFPNDYKIHQGDEVTKSLLLSFLVGGSFLSFEIFCLKEFYSWWESLLSLALLGPWIGFSLDRLRESIEHWGMPARRYYGSKEFGLGFWGLLIGGGPWGQPCHFSHHLAPDLSWYQQLKLHLFLKKLNLSLPSEFLIEEGLNFKQIKNRFSTFLPERSL